MGEKMLRKQFFSAAEIWKNQKSHKSQQYNLQGKWSNLSALCNLLKFSSGVVCAVLGTAMNHSKSIRKQQM